ncbi:hypothetical protein NMG60_11000294 [Bertholletia excelsa]
MGFLNRPLLLLFLLLVIGLTSKRTGFAEARPLSVVPEQRYSKIFATLGLACKCCDGSSGKCTSAWVGSCSNLECLPWKFH